MQGMMHANVATRIFGLMDFLRSLLQRNDNWSGRRILHASRSSNGLCVVEDVTQVARAQDARARTNGSVAIWSASGVRDGSRTTCDRARRAARRRPRT